LWLLLRNNIMCGVRQASREKGFSFVEVLVAAAALAVAAAVLCGALIRPLQDQMDAERAFRAAFLAQEKAEELKAVPWDQLAGEPEGEVPGYPGFRRSVSVDAPDQFTKRVTVRVSYPLHGAGRGVQTVTFERTVDF